MPVQELKRCQTSVVTSELSPLVLLHGGSWSGDQWRDIAPLLSAHHEVYTPSALGHHGGPVVQRRPVTMWDVIDESERYLDERGLDRPHLAGHSMGGFTALELARRGRAASVCAFSPGGLWSDDLRAQVAKGVRRQLALSRLMLPLTTLLMKSPGMRRRALTANDCFDIGVCLGSPVSAGLLRQGALPLQRPNRSRPRGIYLTHRLARSHAEAAYFSVAADRSRACTAW